jgi:hypothetical protein
MSKRPRDINPKRVRPFKMHATCCGAFMSSEGFKIPSCVVVDASDAIESIKEIDRLIRWLEKARDWLEAQNDKR